MSMKDVLEKAILILLFTGLAGTARAQVTTGQQVIEEQTIDSIERYALYIPAGYNNEPTKKWPLMVTLHGTGGFADEPTQEENIAVLLSRHVVAEIEAGSTRYDEFIVLSPQATAGQWWKGADVNTLANLVITTYQIDTNRLIVTGQSMGGYGTYKTILNQPNKYAGAVPICPALKVSNVNEDLIDHMPIWIHHGDADPTVPYSRSVGFYNAFRALIGGTETTNTGSIIGTDYITKITGQIRFSTYLGDNHVSWPETYARDEVIDWMYTQELPGANQAPILTVNSPDLSSGNLFYGDTTPVSLSAADPDGSITSVKVELDGVEVARTNAASVTTGAVFSNLVPGDYDLRLSAIDDEGREFADIHTISIVVPHPPSNSVAVININTLNGSFEDPASGTDNATYWEDALGLPNSVSRIVNAPAKASHGADTLVVGRNSANELKGAAIRTDFLVTEGDQFFLRLNWRAEKSKWDRRDSINWRLFTTEDNSRTGTVDEVASGVITGTDDTFHRPYFDTLMGSVDASQTGLHLWLEIAPNPNVANDERALIDEVVLSAIPGPASDRDNDGLPDTVEENLGTNPGVPDSNGDGIGDLAAYAFDVASFTTPRDALPTLANNPTGVLYNLPSTRASNILYSVDTTTSLMTATWYRIAFKQPNGVWEKDTADDDTMLYPGIDQIAVNTNTLGVDVLDSGSRPQGFYRTQLLYVP